MADKITLEDVSKMKVADLKKALKEKGLSVTGSKSELVERITESLGTDDTPVAEAELSDAVLDDATNVDTVKETKQQPIAKVAPQIIMAPEKTEEAPESQASETTTETESAEKVSVSTSLSEEDKIKKRAERFGLVNEDAKKQARAERFGITSTKLSTAGTGADLEVLKKRAERFGTVTSTSLSKVDEAEKIKKRKDRFGDVTSVANNTPSKFAKITFDSTSSADDEKKKARAARFGQS